MDYSLTTPEERIALVNTILEQTPKERLNSKYLEKLASYIIDSTMTKKEKKEKKINT